MGGWWTFAHAGSFIVSQCRKALSRHSSSHSGSPFLAEMRRMTSSLRPGATDSDSMSVTKPARYSRAAMSWAVIESEVMSGKVLNSESIESVRKSQGSRDTFFSSRFPATNRLRVTSYLRAHATVPCVQNLDFIDDAGRGPRLGGRGRSNAAHRDPPRASPDHDRWRPYRRGLEGSRAHRDVVRGATGGQHAAEGEERRL